MPHAGRVDHRLPGPEGHRHHAGTARRDPRALGDVEATSGKVAAGDNTPSLSDADVAAIVDWETLNVERWVRSRRIDTPGRWAGGFVAHHYTRYLGDLSGGQAIGRLMKRHFGFETNGILFYLFDQIADPKAFKETSCLLSREVR